MQLDLTIDQINTILNALGNAPYVQVSALIAEIQRQGQEQLNQPPVEEAPAP